MANSFFCFCLLPSAYCLRPAFFLPLRRQPSSPSVVDRRNSRLVQSCTIPKFTGYRSMRLIERFAIIRVGATSHFLSTSEFYFYEPIRIGKGLPREAHYVGLAVLQNRLGLLESGNTSGSYDWRVESSSVHRDRKSR